MRLFFNSHLPLWLSWRYHFLRWRYDRDERFAIREGVSEALDRGLQMNIRGECIVTPPDAAGRLILEPGIQDPDNNVGINKLLLLAGEKHFDVVRRVFVLWAWLARERRVHRPNGR